MQTQHLDKATSFSAHCQGSKAEKGGGGGEDKDRQEIKLQKSWKDLKLGEV